MRAFRQQCAVSSRGPNAHCVCKDGLGGGVAHAIDILERELNALLVGDVHSRDTSCLHAQRRPATHTLHGPTAAFEPDTWT